MKLGYVVVSIENSSGNKDIRAEVLTVADVSSPATELVNTTLPGCEIEAISKKAILNGCPLTFF